MPRRGQPLGNDDGLPIDPQVQDDARMEDGQPIHPLNHDGDNDSQDSSSEDEDNNKVEIASLLATSRKNVRKELAKMRLPAQLKQGSTAEKQQAWILDKMQFEATAQTSDYTRAHVTLAFSENLAKIGGRFKEFILLHHGLSKSRATWSNTRDTRLS